MPTQPHSRYLAFIASAVLCLIYGVVPTPDPKQGDDVAARTRQDAAASQAAAEAAESLALFQRDQEVMEQQKMEMESRLKAYKEAAREYNDAIGSASNSNSRENALPPTRRSINRYDRTKAPLAIQRQMEENRSVYGWTPQPDVGLFYRSHEAPLVGFWRSSDGNESNKMISELTEQLRAAETDEQKEQLKSKLQSELEKQYDQYLEHHEAPLAELEARVEKLRTEFEWRKKAKGDLVKLRLDTIWYDSQGLGWPNQSRSNPFPSSMLGTSVSGFEGSFGSPTPAFSPGHPAQPSAPGVSPEPPMIPEAVAPLEPGAAR